MNLTEGGMGSQCLLDYLGVDNQEGLVTPLLQLVDWSYNGPA